MILVKKMKNNFNIVAIIPARGGSKGIPRKNLVDFCGRPLLFWTIYQALNSKYIKKVFVSSDDEEILNISKKFEANIVKRPKDLALDISSSEEALLHAIDYIEISHKEKIDVVVFLQATSPVRTSEDINDAVRFFVSQKADSLFSAALLEDFCIWEIKGNKSRSISYDYKNRKGRKDRFPYYLENGSIYIFKPDIIKRYKNRLGGKIIVYPMPFWKSCEIDKEEDLEICEYFMKKKILRQAVNPLC